MRSNDDVERLISQLQRQIWDEYRVDIMTFHNDWLEVAREAIRVGPSCDAVSMLRAEGALVLCVAFVAVRSAPAVFNLAVIGLWASHARQYGAHHPDIDDASFTALIRHGYMLLRAWGSSV